MFSPLVKGEGTWNGELELVEEDFEQPAMDSLFPSIAKLQFGERTGRLFDAKDGDHFIDLPKTFLTRKGAIVLFSTPKERHNQFSKKSNEVCSCRDVFTKHAQKTEKLCPTCQIQNEPEQRKKIFVNLLEGILKKPDDTTAHDQLEKNISDDSFLKYDNTKTRDTDVYNILSRPKTMCALHRYNSAKKKEKQRPKTVATCRRLPPEIEQAKAHPRITSAKPRPTTRVLGKLRYQNLISEFEEDINIHSDTLEIHYPSSPINQEPEQPPTSPIEQKSWEQPEPVDGNIVEDISTIQYASSWVKDDVDHHGDEEQCLVDDTAGYSYVTDSLDFKDGDMFDMIDGRSRAVSSLCDSTWEIYSETDVSTTTDRPRTSYSEYQDGSMRSSGVFTSGRPTTALSSRRASKTPSELEQSYKRPISQLTQDSGVNVGIFDIQNDDESPQTLENEDFGGSDKQWATKRGLSLPQGDSHRTRVKSAPCSSTIKKKAWSLRTRSAGYRKQQERESIQIPVSSSADVVRVPCTSIFDDLDQRKQEHSVESDGTSTNNDVATEYQDIQTAESVCHSAPIFPEPSSDSLMEHGRLSSLDSLKSIADSIVIEEQPPPPPPPQSTFSEDSRPSSQAESYSSAHKVDSDQEATLIGERAFEYDDSERRDESGVVSSQCYPRRDEHIDYTEEDVEKDKAKITDIHNKPTPELSNFEDKPEKETFTSEYHKDVQDSSQRQSNWQEVNQFTNVPTQLQVGDSSTKSKLRPKTAKPIRKPSFEQSITSQEDSKEKSDLIELDLVSTTPQKLEERPSKSESVTSLAKGSLSKIELPSGEGLDIQGIGKEDEDNMKIETTTSSPKINLSDLVKKNDEPKIKTPVASKTRKPKDIKKTRVVKMKEEKVEKLQVIPTIDEKLIEALENGEENIELSEEILEKFAPIEKLQDAILTIPGNDIKNGASKAKASSKKGKRRKKKDIKVDQATDDKKKLLEEKQRHEEELELLKEREDEQTKLKEEVLERQRAIDEETAQRMEQEVEARKKEEEAMLALKEARRKAKEERDKRREEDAERRRQDNAQRRKEKKLRELEIQERELELEKQRVDREKRKAELDARKAREREAERIAEEQRREEERLRLLEMEDEQTSEDDLVREAEETLQRLAREREYREQMRKIAEAQKTKLEKQENERRLKEQQERAAIEAQRKRIENERIARENEERERIRQLRSREAVARMKAAQEAAKRRAWALQRREQNIDRMTHLKSTRQAQKITGPYAFSYYPNIPKKVMELPYDWNSKKKRVFKPTSKKKKPNESTAQ